ncbi:glycosyltransferase family 2 protein [Saccharicrinis sp. GN24d3]|uniref:glycosyltransferase family 2 protein n=1 Tax=Saccharicrinis sp. GN24d3 TaxID=3458416 RepID=UPI004036BA83
MNTPLVSIIISCYNQEKLISNAIESVQNQNYENTEIIVIDDCSIDKSWDILKTHSSSMPNLFVYRNIENKGISYTRSRGFKLAKGEFISYLDGDDIYLRNKIEDEVVFLDKNLNFDIVFSNFNVIDTSKIETKYISELRGHIFENGVELKDILFDDSLIRFEMFRKSSLDKLKMFYDETFKVYEDWEFRIRYALKLKIGYNSSVCSIYCHQNNSLSSNEDSIVIYRKKVIKKHFWSLLKNLNGNSKCRLIWFSNEIRLAYSKNKNIKLSQRILNIIVFALIAPYRLGAIRLSLKHLIK